MDQDRVSNRRQFLKGRTLLNAMRRVLVGQPGIDAGEVFDLKSTDDESAHIPRKQSQLATHLQTFSRNAMGCQFEFLFNRNQYTQAGDAALEMLDLIDELESQMTIYSPESTISQLNQANRGDRVRVSRSVFECFQIAKDIFENTRGAFDISAGRLSEVWGFDQRQPTLPSPTAIEEALEKTGFQHVELHEAECSISLNNSELKINLGGIGKGYALDLCRELVSELGIDDILMHGGQSSVVALGDRRTLRQQEDVGWQIGLTHPVHPGTRLREITLKDQCLGTSGSARQAFFHQGKKLGHIIDPRTGWPAAGAVSATVVSDSAARSDALATAFCIMSTEEVEAYCQEQKDIYAILATSTNQRTEILRFGDLAG